MFRIANCTVPPGTPEAGKYCQGIQPGATAYCCGPGQECKEIYYNEEYNTNGLPEGAYLISVQAKERAYTQKLQVAR